jgi:hypothetical protein
MGSFQKNSSRNQAERSELYAFKSVKYEAVCKSVPIAIRKSGKKKALKVIHRMVEALPITETWFH